jgi:ribosomal protein L18
MVQRSNATATAQTINSVQAKQQAVHLHAHIWPIKTSRASSASGNQRSSDAIGKKPLPV